MSDVWVLTKEEGSYSDYEMAILAIASSAERAKELADNYLLQEYGDALKRCERYRANWPEEGRSIGSWDTSAEQAYPTPTLEILAWEPNPDRPGNWHFSKSGYHDERWTIFRASLDALAPDGCLDWR